MDNQFVTSPSNSNYKRKIAFLFAFAIFFLFLGRHLSFLPTVNLSEKTNEEEFEKKVEEITKNKTGFYSVYYKNLNSDEEFGINDNQIQTGASVNKLPIVAALYYLDKEGKINLDDKITVRSEDVQNYGTGSIRYQKMPQVYSLRNLAKLALNESDNTAAHVIALRIGEENIQFLVNTWGMKSTNMTTNKTTVKDMGILLERIYNNEIANGPQTKELLDFMTNTKFEDRLALGISNDASLHHKTGDGEGFVHDVGIIEGDGKKYILGVMTSDIGEKEDDTKITIGKISEMIFKGLQN